MTKRQLKFYGKKLGIWFALPTLIYTVFYFLFNPAHLTQFSSAFYLDRGDGWQNVWNFWWVNFSITDLGQNPYYSQFIHFPHGINLVPQTMNIFNGLVGIPLMWAGFSLVQTVNIMVVFSFAIGGLTMFWLAHHLTKSYVASLVAGFMFTFSAYHFAHGIGHMQLISLEWVPLFLLFWIRLLETKRYRFAIAAGIALILTILCDYYYFIYSSSAAVIIAGYMLYTKKLIIDRKLIYSILTFTGVALTVVGPLLASLLWLNHSDKLTGEHDAYIFSLDGLATIIPGGVWYWNSITEFYNSNIPGYHSETSMHFGVALLALLGVAFFARKKLKLPSSMYVWWIIAIIFFILSLGPRFRLFGKVVDSVPLPYAWLEHIFPTLKLSGMPIRMIFMVQLAAVIIAAFVIAKIKLNNKVGVALVISIVAVAFIDTFPRPLPLSIADTQQPYAYKIDQLPLAKGSGIIDNAAETANEALYAQTMHQKPMAFGYVTRTPQSVETKSFLLFADLEQGRHQRLCSVHKIRYLATRKTYDNGYPVIYQQNDGTGIRIYDLRNGKDC